MRMNELKQGECGKILTVEGKGALRRRLMDMGLTPGTTVFIRKVAPLGDPIELHLRGYELTLRKEDASNITVEMIPAKGCNFCGVCPGPKRRRRRLFGRRRCRV